ncbi:NADPH:quinone oxidoreductase family protein [Mycobacterium sp. 21AC1]|uniref:NADPH:quinone oxidoreductase family protein n=1 Tax=[Mycobacterium] appelbergii TaxID=2939269 RepID=UPI002938E80E|nr:NADPH:quinone oxidoreductase family protein [Mycobacterium sp. 21AC1]MDV3125955.1 NADPH:quinone oxidoreductase family protein [Mycobacterium sp. 21AC1]
MAGAWTVRELGEPGTVLRWEDMPVPLPAAGQLRVRVEAASCNFADVLLCRGAYQHKPDPPFTPGLEMCGVVDAVGRRVDPALQGALVVGQPVLPHGGFAELALMESVDALAVPSGIDQTSAATLHLTYLTAWLGLHRRAAVQPGSVVVVTAAAGGVGSAAVQLARAAGARVVGIASGPAKVDTVRRLGAELAIDGADADVVATVREFAPTGADIVFDPVGGAAYESATKYVAFEGTIVVVGFASGTIPAPRLNHPFVKNYTIAGLHWALYRQYHPDLIAKAQSEIFALALAGTITPLITRCVGIDGVPSALEDLAHGRTQGKTVIRQP